MIAADDRFDAANQGITLGGRSERELQSSSRKKVALEENEGAITENLGADQFSVC